MKRGHVEGRGVGSWLPSAGPNFRFVSVGVSLCRSDEIAANLSKSRKALAKRKY